MDFVVIKHTLFAIPFAYLGAFLAKGGVPEPHVLFWIGLAFLGARCSAMALNNLIDKDIDAKNPRTCMRELPSGKITLYEVWGIIIASYSVLFYSAYMLNPLCLKLSPIVVLTSIIYPYLKRFVPLTHYVLGLNLAYAPAGGWLAVTGVFDLNFGTPELAIILLMLGVIFWVAGFDIIYSLQDLDFDRKNRLYSIPSFFGVRIALRLSLISHIAMLMFLIGLMYVLQLGPIFKVGLVIIGLLIWYEHTIVNDFTNIPIAFFNVNAGISLSMLVFTVMDVIIKI